MTRSQPPSLFLIALLSITSVQALAAQDPLHSQGDPMLADDPHQGAQKASRRDEVPALEFSGIYPHLAFFNDENECGTGALVPWAGRLWVVTYAPHAPRGSSDKLYEITPGLELIVRPESIGGTPANRMIHNESHQLFIGPYVIDAKRKVRTIPYSEMFGRPTANARHLSDPAGKVYCASMEEALYEIDVETLDVTTIFHDEADADAGPKAGLPGYHGKGLYAGQERLVYANNGEHGGQAMRDPSTTSGVLAQWAGKGNWDVVLRNQFTEITGPGGIHGNENPATDPLWAVGWDAKSLILMLLDGGQWHRFRLPKASHSYDGAHGWNTEWPRIREIGEGDALLMTMHGMFWSFPKSFSLANTAGIEPRSTYLKVIGDFCRWGDRVVFGCDDTAKNEFLNKRRAKGEIAAPQSQSNLWFVEPERIDRLGPVLGRGAVWLAEKVVAAAPSDPFLFAGFAERGVHLSCDVPTTFTFEVDVAGTGEWEKLSSLEVDGDHWHAFSPQAQGAWIRVKSSEDLERGTAWFAYGDDDVRRIRPAATRFKGLARSGAGRVTGGVLRPRGANKRSLHFAASDSDGEDVGYFELGADMRLRRVENGETWKWLKQNAAIPSRKGVIEEDEASVVYIDDAGRRFRLPRSSSFADQGARGSSRLCREVATERDLFNCHGTFFELPAENAGGFGRVRPVATHDRRISDFCSYRGLLVMSGIDLDAADGNRHVIQSDDRKTGLWVGAIDDIWELGKPVGVGGPWKETSVTAGAISDPYLMAGYDEKKLMLASGVPTTVTIEIDISGAGNWHRWKAVHLAAGIAYEQDLPDGFQANWVRFTSSSAATLTAQLVYE